MSLASISIPIYVSTNNNVGNVISVSPNGDSVDINFSPEIQIPPEATNISLSLYAFTGVNYFPNIGVNLTGHYQFIFSDDLGNTSKYFVDFPEGYYSVDELNTQLNRLICNKYPTLSSFSAPLFTLKGNTATGKLDLYINAVGYYVNHNALTSVTVNPGGFIPGSFSPAGPALTTTAKQSFEGSLNSVFGKVTELNVLTSFGGGQFLNGVNSYVLGTVNLTNVPASGNIEFYPPQKNKLTIPVLAGQNLSKLRVWIEDQNFSGVLFNFDWSAEITLSYKLSPRYMAEANKPF